MKMRVIIRVIPVVIVFLGLSFSQVYAISSRGRVLSEVSVRTDEEYKEITIGFNFLVKYSRHFPQNLGKEVRIQLAPLPTSVDDLAALKQRESLFPPSNSSGVVRVEYEGRGLINPTVTVVFDRMTSYEVKQGKDFRSVIIMVPLQEGDQKEIEATGESALGIVPRYVISLIASPDPIKESDYPSPEKTENYKVYTSTAKKMDGTLWNRLRVGFFERFSQARKTADNFFKEDYPKLWIEKASLQEVADNGGQTAALPAEDQADEILVVSAGLDPQKQEDLLKEGVETMVQKNYPRAIQIYTKLLESSDSEVLELAQFQLALAREYNGHLAHAKSEYRNYLRAYPQGLNSVEARNRLKGLLSARPLMGSDSRDTGVAGKSTWESEYYGSISMTYDYDKSFAEDDEDTEDTTNISSLTTNLDVTYHLSTDNYQLETVFIGSYESSLLADEEDEPRVSSLYLDFENNSSTFTSRWGRQSGSSGGVRGRFDGGQVGFLLTEKVRLNLVAGFPVNLSSDPVETDKYFYGINFDLGRYYDHWEYNLFLINQMAESLTDRRAVGGEARYVGSGGSFFALLDYDILFNDLNTVLVAGNWTLPNKSTWLNLSADFRKSPLLATSNALIGQTTRSLEALEAKIGKDALRQLARDRTLDSSFVTLGFTHPFSDDFQIAGDVTWSKLGGAPASGGVEKTEATDNDWYYSLQFINNDVFTDGDISTIGLRYSDTERRDTYTLKLDTRYPIFDVWRINPELQIDYRVNKILTGEQWRFRPSLRVEYRMPKRWRFEIEGGYSYANEELEGLAEDRKGYYASLTLRKDF